MKTFAVIIFLALTGCVTTTTGGGNNTVDNTKMAVGYFMKGLAQFQEKNYELASAEFNHAIQTDSSNKLSYYYLGLISNYQDKPNDAIKYYKEAINVDSNFSEAYNALGATYSSQQKWDDAIKAYNKALENKLYTTPHIPWLNIGRVYMAQKKYEKAIEAFRDAERYSYQDDIIYELGNALFEAGKIKESINQFQEGVKLSPQNASIRYGLALAYLKDGQKKNAITEFRKAAELAPKTDIATRANAYINTMR
jgi:Tfp pilus assembly protein PilF